MYTHAQIYTFIYIYGIYIHTHTITLTHTPSPRTHSNVNIRWQVNMCYNSIIQNSVNNNNNTLFNDNKAFNRITTMIFLSMSTLFAALYTVYH